MRGSTRIVHDASKVVHLAQRLHRHYVSSYHGGQRRLHIETVVIKEIFVENIQFEVVSWNRFNNSMFGTVLQVEKNT